MKWGIATLLAGIVIGSAGVAAATTGLFTHRGITCVNQASSVVCFRNDHHGYGVVVNKRYVSVIRNSSNKTVFFQPQR
jgi:cell division protein FtsI/penicillin-binding protein 2